MKHVFSIFALAILAFSISAQTKTIDFAELERTIEAELAATKTPGAAFAIVSGDKVIFAKGFGTTSAEGGNPVLADTLFRMGSTTKMFTAAALAALADAGKIRLDAPVGNYLKNLPPKVANLTAHQLLSQSSGLRDLPPTLFSNDDAGLKQNIFAWKDDVFFTEPNKIYSYSSANYWLAGLLSEEIYGKPYADVLAEILFKPLGMTRSAVRPTEAMTYPLALGHQVQNGAANVVRPIDNNSAKYPGGSMFSSANELARWAIAMLNNGRIDGKQVLPAAVVENLQKPQFYLPGEERAFYGYGLLGYTDSGVKTVSHGGASRGYGSTIFFAPEQKIAIVALANTSGQTLQKSRRKAMEMLLPLKTPANQTNTETAAAAEELRRYAGKYEHAPQTWEFFVRDAKLFVKQDDGKEFELKKTGKDTFGFEQGAFLFVPNEKGEFEHIFMGLYAARKTSQLSFNYLNIDGQILQTGHKLKYEIKVGDPYSFLGKVNHQPVFNGKGFNVSVAAFSGKDSFLMVHAEMHTDGSGGLDYGNLQPDALSGIKFTSKEQCAELDLADISAEHDLNFLKVNGFDPFPAIYIKQYFTTSKDGTSEIVITYGRRTSGCGGKDVTPQLKAQVNEESRNAVKIINKDK